VVLAQAWRGNAPRIARLLRGCVVEPLDAEGARQVGLLLAEGHTADVIDAVVVRSAFRRRDSIVTSDPVDITRLTTPSRAFAARCLPPRYPSE
jgi:hypothetical protein